jgi:hypothetical protein
MARADQDAQQESEGDDWATVLHQSRNLHRGGYQGLFTEILFI